MDGKGSGRFPRFYIERLGAAPRHLFGRGDDPVFPLRYETDFLGHEFAGLRD
jgi:hypothetical protein